MLKSLVIAFSALVFSPLVAAASVRFIPIVLTPDNESVWKVGSTQNMTWDVTKATEEHFTNTKIVLLTKRAHPDWGHPVAQGFDLLAGWVTVTVPSVTEERSDYQLVLFWDTPEGESNSFSKLFTISFDSDDLDDSNDLDDSEDIYK